MWKNKNQKNKRDRKASLDAGTGPMAPPSYPSPTIGVVKPPPVTNSNDGVTTDSGKRVGPSPSLGPPAYAPRPTLPNTATLPEQRMKKAASLNDSISIDDNLPVEIEPSETKNLSSQNPVAVASLQLSSVNFNALFGTPSLTESKDAIKKARSRNGATGSNTRTRDINSPIPPLPSVIQSFRPRAATGGRDTNEVTDISSLETQISPEPKNDINRSASSKANASQTLQRVRSPLPPLPTSPRRTNVRGSNSSYGTKAPVPLPIDLNASTKSQHGAPPVPPPKIQTPNGVYSLGFGRLMMFDPTELEGGALEVPEGSYALLPKIEEADDNNIGNDDVSSREVDPPIDLLSAQNQPLPSNEMAMPSDDDSDQRNDGEDSETEPRDLLTDVVPSRMNLVSFVPLKPNVYGNRTGAPKAFKAGVKVALPSPFPRDSAAKNVGLDQKMRDAQLSTDSAPPPVPSKVRTTEIELNEYDI